MELRLCRYFIAVADELNFHRAAERVGIAQSPLSQAIRRLEESLGAQLFERNRGHVELTDAGRLFLPDARDLVARAAEAASRMGRASHGEEGILRVAYLTAMMNPHFSDLLGRFRANYPKIELVLHDLVPDPIVDGVGSGRFDLGLVRPDRVIGRVDFEIREVWREPIVVALPKGHWLSAKGPIRLNWMKHDSFVMMEQSASMGYNEVVRQLCRKARFIPKIQAEANHLQAIVWLVNLGFGAALVPASMQHFHRESVVYVPLHQPPSVSAAVIWRKNNHSPIIANFLKLIAEKEGA